MGRAVFEEIAEGQEHRARPAAPAPGGGEAKKRRGRRAVALWLMVVAGLVALMVIVGGATRLTDSGLSITEWKPVTGAVPPLSAESWQAEFDKYKTIPEFQEQNHWMTLGDFKTIYWWEWGHRLLGRIIGLAFFLPLLWFAVRGRIPPGWGGRLALLGGLGALQGTVGWWMVASGLSERVDVAPYRLAVHLGLAFVIFGLLLWYVLTLWRSNQEILAARRRRIDGLMTWSGVLVGAVFVQILSGALVAGLDAGLQYTDWPLMGGSVFPSEGLATQSLLAAPFEDAGFAQFNHRLIAYALLVLGFVFWRRAARSGHGGAGRWGAVVMAGLGVQATLGVLTLVTGVPLWLALLHQLGALVLLALAVRARFEIAYPREERIAS